METKKWPFILIGISACLLTGVSHLGLVVDFGVTLACMFAVTLLGIYLFNKIEV
jgi:hypothetical protein